MENPEKIEWDVFETVIAWVESIQNRSEIDPYMVDDFLKLLGVAVTNPTFHMDISEEAGEINYEKLTGFLPGDIEGIKKLMNSRRKILNKALFTEVRKYVNYLEKYNSKIQAGESEGLKDMEDTIRWVAGEYSIIINDLKPY